MAYRMLEVTFLSAKNLKNVNLFKRMEVYAVASIAGYPMTRQYTPADLHGGRNPTWNVTLWFAVPPTADATTGSCLHILLRVKRMFGADCDVDEVIVPLAEVLAGIRSHGGDNLGGLTMPQFASYQIRKVHRTETRSVLNLTYRLGPVMAPQPHVPLWERDDDLIVPYPALEELIPPPPRLRAFWPELVVPMPPSPIPWRQVVSMPPSPKPIERMVSIPPIPKPWGQVVSMPPSPKPVEPMVSMPPSRNPSWFAAVPSSPKPSGYASVPPSPKPSAHSVPLSPYPATHVTIPPSPKPSGHVPRTQSPKPASRYVSAPPSTAPAGRHMSMPASPAPYNHVSVPPSPKPAM